VDDVKLTRTNYLSTGIFSTMVAGQLKFYCASHAYPNNAGSYIPKVGKGTYRCTRYWSPKHACDVFLINDVPNCEMIEFHILNFPQTESEGCEGIGLGIDLDAPVPMITQSREAFEKFMSIFEGVNEFTLVVA